jgi:hypothetical protein
LHPKLVAFLTHYCTVLLPTNVRTPRHKGKVERSVGYVKSNALTHTEFLELILQDELAVRSQRLRQRRVKAASFREMRSLDDFDFSFNKTIRKKQIYDLATCRFIEEPRDVLFLASSARRERARAECDAHASTPNYQVRPSSRTSNDSPPRNEIVTTAPASGRSSILRMRTMPCQRAGRAVSLSSEQILSQPRNAAETPSGAAISGEGGSLSAS